MKRFLILSLLIVCFLIGYSQSFELFFERGLQKLDEEEYLSAINDFDAAIELDANNNHAIFWRGYCNLKLDDYKKAIVDFDKLISRDNSNSDYYYWRGICKSRLGKYRDALFDFNSAISINPNDQYAYFQRGKSYFYLRNYKEALPDFEKVIGFNYQDAYAFYWRGSVKYELGSFLEALYDLNKAISIESDDVDFYKKRGEIYFALKLYGEAVHNFQKAKEFDLTDEYPSLKIIEANFNKGDYNNVIEECNYLISLNTIWTDYGYFWKARANENLDNFEEALQDYEMLFSISNNFPNAYLNRAKLFLKLGKHKEALLDFEKCPKDLEVNALMGVTKFELKDYPGALIDINNYLKEDPLSAEGYFYRGKIMRQLNQPQKAIEDFNRVQDINPNFKRLFYERGNIKLSNDDYKGAMEDFSMEIAINPSNYEAYNFRGIVKNILNDTKGAQSDFNIADSLAPNNASYMKLMRVIYSVERNQVSNDVSQNIPKNPEINSNSFAVIIANENYENEVDVQFAINDGRVFKSYCLQTLGIPEKNIKYIENATFGNIRASINWINQVILTHKGDAKVYFYYAGHGMPDEKERSAYILPVDGFASDVESAIKIDFIYDKLSEHDSRLVVVFMDACFSGSGVRQISHFLTRLLYC